MRRILATTVLSVLVICLAGVIWLWFFIHNQAQPSLSSQPNPPVSTVQPGPSSNITSNTPPPLPKPPTRTTADLPMLTLGTSNPSVTRLQEILGELGYLPIHWSPRQEEPSSVTAQIEDGLNPPDGSWQWQTGTPASLQSLWQPGVYNVMTQGAVMRFQEVHQLDQDGVAGPKLWSSLIQAVLNQEKSPSPYTYVTVSTHQPETLRIWSAGQVVLTSPANTGISAAPTSIGTFAVYLQYRTQTMSGTNPDGEHYSDPGVPWVSYFNGGEAIHGFVRPGYGYPQSLGCVELPLQKAQQAWNYIHMGTLVTISK